MSDSFADWNAKIAEAFCVERGIPCTRKFTDPELERPRAQVKQHMADAANVYAETMIQRDKLKWWA